MTVETFIEQVMSGYYSDHKQGEDLLKMDLNDLSSECIEHLSKIEQLEDELNDADTQINSLTDEVAILTTQLQEL